MTRKMIAQLVSASYTNDSLDNKKVQKIASFLKRSDLVLYIRGLKLSEKAKTISLVLPNRNLYNTSLLGDTKKRIVVEEYPSLLIGAKIIDNDMVYDVSLKNNLDEFIQSL